MSRTIIVGDVHGCIDELRELVEKVRVESDDRWVFAGDLIHKGPHSEEVVRHVIKMSGGCKVDLVRGNHEETALKKRDIDLRESEWAFLASAPRWHHVPGGLVVHGGIPEQLTELPTDPSSVEALSNSKRKYFDQMLRLRFVSPDGKFRALQDVGPDDKFWAERYDGRFGHVYFGHEPFVGSAPKRFENAKGIDLSAVFGGYLCAVVLTDGYGADAPVTVRARKQYCPRADMGD
jgi:serine/threonine protein phosphatase 1